jgi:D-alanyl-D-alanine carboxypeptidase (penicillin-binding protein 5/6)
MLPQMLSTLISVLSMGLLPTAGWTSALPSVPPQIVVAPPASELRLATRLSASGVAIIDAQSGQRIYGRQFDVPRPMASLTKLMTAMLIVEHHDLSDVVRVPQSIDTSQSNVRLPAGEQFTVGDVLSAMLIASANDAAVTLAVYHSGSVEAFVAEMNARAATLGLQSTSFANPAGLDAPLQLSTPQDIAWLTMAALRHPAIQKRLGMRGTTITSLQGSEVALSHTHVLLHERGAVRAGKTGTTSGANECLMSVVEEEGRRYVVVLLDSLQRYRDMHVILDALSHPPSDHTSVSLETSARP